MGVRITTNPLNRIMHALKFRIVTSSEFLQHVRQIRTVGWIRKYRVLEIAGAYPGTNGKRKYINYIACLVTQKMGTKNAFRSFFDHHLVTGVFLRNPARGIPSGSHFFLHSEFQPALACFGLAKPHRRYGRNRKDRSEEHTSELQSPDHLVCRLLLEKKK